MRLEAKPNHNHNPNPKPLILHLNTHEAREWVRRTQNLARLTRLTAMVKSPHAQTVEACKFSLNLVEEALCGVDDGGDAGNCIPEKRSSLVDDLSVILKVPDRKSERL